MGAFKLGKMTFGSLFKKPETTLYPIETKPQPEGLKGHISIGVDDCILCGMCDRSCPTSCIAVDKEARTWVINRFSCIQCGYCVTVCPKKCLFMEPGYAPASTKIESESFEVPAEAKAGASGGKPSKDGKAKEAEPKAGEPKADEQVAAPAAVDAVLESKISIMDPEKAEKVRAALARS